jgi:hypothetical protein
MWVRLVFSTGQTPNAFPSTVLAVGGVIRKENIAADLRTLLLQLGTGLAQKPLEKTGQQESCFLSLCPAARK